MSRAYHPCPGHFCPAFWPLSFLLSLVLGQGPGRGLEHLLGLWLLFLRNSNSSTVHTAPFSLSTRTKHLCKLRLWRMAFCGRRTSQSGGWWREWVGSHPLRSAVSTKNQPPAPSHHVCKPSLRPSQLGPALGWHLRPSQPCHLQRCSPSRWQGGF